MNFKINPIYIDATDLIIDYVHRFNNSGALFGNGDRNKIKLFDFEGIKINIKSFKIPNLFNKIAYKYFRKSKARRSFEYATILLEREIGTPQPIAFLENYNWLGLRDSYYVSEHLVTELTYRELIEVDNYPDFENILRQFTRFTFKLHEKGIEFLDHSPGNTLIKKRNNNEYDFFLVDLNRMNFHTEMSFVQRMNNFRRLTPRKEMIAIMSNEYAKLYSAKTEAQIFEKMWEDTVKFQEEFAKKQRLKKRLKFWKS
ncbi:Kdo domain containing protein [Flavobacterium sp. ALJ2]|uniref:Kdo domain containing protein n=1 Tax=Flavobacterium sp. ALJ2 TaxID=2786960 RepID=UPI00189FCC70|nr:Kdo domain containing protein [Flavobacterium sp. ALJ2]MBF7093132.1 Kdo domain containing protein [Flavobacterium sp. ALJ2]